ncbi:MAG: T9SS type A sorting domain-containing protein [bacterium]|nr:T9SS type A sorting domain-containing protein [bacterium]
MRTPFRVQLMSTAILCLLTGAAAGFPLAPNGEADQMTLLGRWSEGACHSVAAVGDVLIFNHGGQLEFRDYADPAAPVVISLLEVPTYPAVMFLVGTTLVVSDQYHDILLVDVSDPATPAIAGSVVLAERIASLAGADGWLYVKTSQYVAGVHTEGLYPVDISDPAAPVVHAAAAAYFGSSHPRMAAGSGRLVMDDAVYDVLADPRHPASLGNMPVSVTRLLIENGMAYGVGGSNGNLFYIFDMGGSGVPALRGSAVAPYTPNAWGQTMGLDLQGTDLVAADYAGAIYTWDVSDPDNPPAPAMYDCQQDVKSIAAVPARAFVSLQNDHGLIEVDISDPSLPLQVTTEQFGKPLYGVVVDSNRAYVYAHDDTIDILDVTDPAAPVKIGRVDTGDEIWGFDARGDYLFVNNDTYRVMVYDVSNPAAAVLTDRFGSEDEDGKLFEENDLIYVGTDDGVTVVDAHDPYDIFQRGFCATPFPLRDFSVQGRYAYVATTNYSLPEEHSDFVVIDIGNPDAPAIISQLTVPGAIKSIAVDGRWAYAAVDSGAGYFEVSASTVKIIDVGDPYNPTLRGAFPAPLGSIRSGQSGKGLAVAQGYLYAAGNHLGVLVYDVSDPADVRESGYFNTGDRSSGLALAIDRLFVSDFDDGLYILRNDGLGPAGVTPHAGTLRLAQNYPNPFNPQTAIAFELQTADAASLCIFDVAGRLVKTLVDGAKLGQGRHEMVWNGCDDAGRQCASGTYFYRLEAGAYSETKRMTFVK